MGDTTQTADNEHILIVSDSADEVGDIQRLLIDDFGSVLKATGEADGLQLFRARRPLLLILAFEEIGRAEHFYLSLYRHDKHIYEVPHQTLLLCKSSESEKAYHLCNSGTFDDFVADRPLYEPYRLRLSVAQAIKRRSQEHHSRLLNNQLEKITLGLHQFDHFIRDELDVGGGQHRKIIGRFHHFTQRLATDLEQLEESLLHSSSGSSLPVNDKKNLKIQFNQFLKNSLHKESKEVEAQLNMTGEWLNRLNDGYRDYAQSVQQVMPGEHSIHIMLVDDDAFYRDALISMLKEEGVDAVGINDGKSAISELKRTTPDLILLDYKMPGPDGLDTLIELKSKSKTRTIPVIMLTGMHERAVVDQCIQAGAADYIVKPSDRHTIMNKIEGLVPGKRISASK